MLNLKLLEKRLDKSLALETKESLRLWLKQIQNVKGRSQTQRKSN